MTATYFFDSYALFEILSGNPAYERFTQGVAVVTTRLNLMELHYGILRHYGQKDAEAAYRRFLPFCIAISDDSIIEANLYRHEQRKKRLSYVDCLGFVLSKKHGVRFLTGDRQFRDVEGVEFVQ